MSIIVLGAGAFGTALAISLGRKGPVSLWARNPADMVECRENTQRLPGHKFPDTLNLSADERDIQRAQLILIAVPTQKMRSFLNAHATLLHAKPLVACCKGIELNTGLGPTKIIQQEVPTAIPAILTGPSFADDIAAGLPTALTLACADPVTGEHLQQKLTTPNIRIYRTTDVTGAELGGALKNVIAIACGAAIGAGLGESARAAVLTRGFAEMQRLAAQLGADPETLNGLSGFGDLTLTCTSIQSRNYKLGLALGKNLPFDQTTTVEGAATAKAVQKLSVKLNLDLPITNAVVALIDGEIDVRTAMKSLLARPLKEE